MRVTVERPGEPTRSIEVAGGEAILGKSEDCPVALVDPAVSRRHARVSSEGGRVFVEDLGSTNGSSLGGRPISGKTELPPGATLEIGPFKIRIEMPTQAPSKAAGEPVPPPRLAPGFEPLADFFADDGVSEIMVNGPGEIFVERDGRLSLTEVRFADADQIRKAVEGVAAAAGRALDPRRPYLDVRLPDGSRMNAILPPLALRGPCLTIRRFGRTGLTLPRLIELGAGSTAMFSFLHACVEGRTNVLLSGGTSSGKTTLLNGLCSGFGVDERIVTIEDAAELRLPQPHVVPLETRARDADGGGEVTMRDLVRNALRMRPDRIVIGEVRGAEALDMLVAMNSGHEGSLSTIHANTPREALGRLETLVQFAADLPSRIVREQIAGAIRVVVQVNRVPGGKRRISSIAEVTGLEGDQFTMGEIFRFDESTGEGAFRATGYIPRVRERLEDRGVAVDMGWFR